MSERWKLVPGLPCTEASNLGRIRVWDPPRWRLKRQFPLSKRSPYPVIKLGRNKLLVHVLVARAFIGPCPPGMEVNHKNGNKRQSWSDNLEYRTHSGNVQHAYDTGLNEAVRRGASRSMTRRHAQGQIPFHRGEKHHSAKLSTHNVMAIRVSPLNNSQLARYFGVRRETIRDIRARKIWKHI